jgi:hypothetical protein
MVRAQIRAYADAGYDLAVVSTSPTLDLAPLSEHAALVVHRENIGHDIGAWADALPLVREKWPRLCELLLANDSVLGPTRSLTPIVRAIRRRPPGLAGLTDCRIYAEHLQSYFLLAQGRQALGFLTDFFAGLPLLLEKADVIRCGEVALTQGALSAGLHTGAEFGTTPVMERAGLDWLLALAPPSRAEIARLGGEAAHSEGAIWRRLRHRPLNPTHHLWLPLLRQGFPFVKADLVRRNPGRVPGVEHWAHHWPRDALVPVQVVRNHLDSFVRQPGVEGSTESSGLDPVVAG